MLAPFLNGLLARKLARQYNGEVTVVQRSPEALAWELGAHPIDVTAAAPPQPDLLLERDAELSGLAAALDGARCRRGAIVVFEGPPGIGKTTLLGTSKDRARQAGFRAIAARCGELEGEFPFGLVRQLYERFVASVQRERRAQVVARAAELAAPLFRCDMTSDELTTSPGSLYETLHGLYRLTVELAEYQPLMVAVDDIHWCDSASLRFLDFLAARLDELPLILVVTVRLDGSCADRELLTRLVSDPAASVLRLRPLTVAAVGSLVHTMLRKPPTERFSEACHELTGGNPFLVRELIGDLAQRGVPPTADQIDRLGEVIPTAVSRAMLVRLWRLSEAARALARAVAILGDGAPPSLAADFARLEGDEVAAAAEELVRADILESGKPLRFVQPLVKAAVYTDLPEVDRNDGHRNAALLLGDHRARPDQIAAHLLLVNPRGEPGVVQTLRRAAEWALARGAPEVALSYLRRALSEPPDPETRTDVVLELCRAGARVPGREVWELLRRDLEVIADARERATVAVELSHALTLVADTVGAVQLLRGAIDDLGDADGDLKLRLEAEYISVARLHAETRADASGRLAVRREVAVPGQLAGSILLANAALDSVERIDPAACAAELAELALRDGTLLDEESWVFAYAANSLTWADRYDDAQHAWTGAIDLARRRGSVSMLTLALIWRSHLYYRRGMLREAEADARLSYENARQRDWAVPRAYAGAFLVDALLARGEIDAAADVARQCRSEEPLHYLLHSCGLLRCAQGDLKGGLDDLMRCGQSLERFGAGQNPAVFPWRSNAALAFAELGECSTGESLAQDEVALSSSYGAPSARSRALRALARFRPVREQIALLDAAVKLLEDSPARLDYANAVTDLGRVLRRTGRRAEAQVHLRTALDVAHRCGAGLLRDVVHQELLMSGLRPRRLATAGVDALTVGERRVAELAAQGLSNKNIGQSLFISLKTVETHLSSCYRKLGVRGRLQLRSALGSPGNLSG